MTEQLISELHHITALASDPQKNLEFYAGILGLRLVKKTINFDAPEVYHLYYGNEKGSPGTILTFFPYVGIPKGRKGKGQLTVTSFSIAQDAIEYWQKRLRKFGIPFKPPQKRFDDESVIYFEDHEGLGLELVANSRDKREGFANGNIAQAFAIKGFYGITLSEECEEKTAHLLTNQLDHQLIAQLNNRLRFTTNNTPGTYVDVLCSPDALQGLPGAGTIHHVAFATDNDRTQIAARNKLVKSGYNTTPFIDREYFHSIYFREPGGVLFEIATVPPGFTVDEDIKHLGEALKLPPWEESNRQLIEKVLPKIHLDLTKFRD